MSADDHDSLVGSILEGRYQVECELGRGAMGVVYRARHVKVGRKVAIKVIHRRLLETPTMIERFEREANAAARLIHHNLVGVLDVAELPDGRRMMVLEYASGTSLAQLVGPGAPMDPARAIALLRGVCDGLDEAHRVGLVHRDLKPENVMIERGVDGTETPRIIDFGIAILREADPVGGLSSSSPRLTELGVVLGTPAYMAPEQARGEELDRRCDLFALGVMAFEMLTGNVPFDGTGVEVARQTVANPIPAMAARAPAGWTIDPQIETLVRKLTARDRDERFATAREVRQALDALAFDLPRAAAVVAVRPPTFSEPTTLGGAVSTRPRRSGASRGFTALALGVCIGGVIVGATAIAMRADDRDVVVAQRPTPTPTPSPSPSPSPIPSPSRTPPPADPSAGLDRSADEVIVKAKTSSRTRPRSEPATRTAAGSGSGSGSGSAELEASAATLTTRYREVGKLVGEHPDKAHAEARFRRIDLMSALATPETRAAALRALDAIAADL